MAARALALCFALSTANAWIGRGPNSCANLALSATAPLTRSFCCRGWTSAGESRLCVKPICKSDCGTGTCVSPNRCGCSDGTLRVSCVDGSGDLPGMERKHNHSRHVAHEGTRGVDEHSDRQVIHHNQGVTAVATDGAVLTAATCQSGAACEGAQAQQAARVVVSSDWSNSLGTSCATDNCPQMQFDGGEGASADDGDDGVHEADRECDAIPCSNSKNNRSRQPAASPPPASRNEATTASLMGSADSDEDVYARRDVNKGQEKSIGVDGDRRVASDTVAQVAASKMAAEQPVYPKLLNTDRLESSVDETSYDDKYSGDNTASASAARSLEHNQWIAINGRRGSNAGGGYSDGSSSSAAVGRKPLDQTDDGGSGIARARTAAVLFPAAVDDHRSYESVQYVEGRANDVFVRARMAFSSALDGAERVGQRMSADSATAVEQSPPPPRPPRIATSQLRRQPLVLADSGANADTSGNGLPVILSPVFAAAKPAFPFAAASKPEPAGGRRSGFANAGVADYGTREMEDGTASAGPCSREPLTPAAPGRRAPAAPCAGSGNGAVQAATRAQTVGESPCSASQCTDCGTCGDASAAAAVASAVVSPASRGRVVYRAPQPSELCSPGYVAVSEGDLIVCERIVREQAVASPCTAISGGACLPASQAPCNGCPRVGPVAFQPDADDAARIALVDSDFSASIEGHRPPIAIANELLPEIPAAGGCSSSLDHSGCLPSASAASERRVPCGGADGSGVSGEGGCGAASRGGSNNVAGTPGIGGDSRNGGCWLAARLGIADRDCRRGGPTALPTTLNPNCVHGAVSKRDGTCECNSGFWGERCDKDFDECDAGLHDCAFGCINTFGSYKCVCAPGSAPSSDNDCYVKPCPSCLHGGQCFDGRCHCPAGFRGAQCEEDIDECQDGRNMCSQLCRNTFGSHVCLCRPGFRMLADNRTCEEKSCKSPCLNGGECVRSKCICADGFVGVACQFEEKKLAKKYVHRR